MCLVDDRHTPVNFPQLFQVRYDHLVGCDQHVETEYVSNGTTLMNSSFQHVSHAGSEMTWNVQ